MDTFRAHLHIWSSSSSIPEEIKEPSEHCRRFSGWVLLCLSFVTFFYHFFLFSLAFQLVLAFRSVVSSYRLSFPSVACFFPFWHQWLSLWQLPSHASFSLSLINWCTCFTCMHLHLVDFALNITSSFKFSWFSHSPWAYLGSPCLDLTPHYMHCVIWELKASALASRTA